MTDCQECGTPMPAATRRATYCGSACRARAHRKRANATAMEGTRTVATTPTPPPPGAGVEAALLAELTLRNLVDTTPGQQALALARRIDHGIQDSGAGIAAMSRQLEALRGRMSLENVPVSASAVTGFRQRRREAQYAGGQVLPYPGQLRRISTANDTED